ncbi:hypothetical protein LBMAG42_56860 [Deltaproteobacteria bacterium]|nr:hypothetical protein LBMAG42_56860 [Deltaproteobacteria bacterium]
MRIAVLLHHHHTEPGHFEPLPDADALAAVEAGRWLNSRGVNPGLVILEHRSAAHDTAGRAMAGRDKWIPALSAQAIPTDTADFPRSVEVWRRRMAKEKRGERYPKVGAGDDLLLVLGATTVEALAELLAPSGLVVPPGNRGATWVLDEIDGRWQATEVLQGRAQGELAPMAPPVARQPRPAGLGRVSGRTEPDRPWEEYLPGREHQLVSGEGALLDAHGQRLPGRPIVGLSIDVQWGESRMLFSRVEILSVDEESFEVERVSTGSLRFALADWSAWLRRRLLEGVVTVHLPECDIGWCGGCDGGLVGEQPYPGEEAALVAGRAVGRRARE